MYVFGKDGKKELRGGEPVKRPPGAKPPCRGCPKKSPEQAHEYELSPRNRRLYWYYLRHRATGCEPMDEVTRERFAIIDPIVRSAENGALAQSIVTGMVALFGKK